MDLIKNPDARFVVKDPAGSPKFKFRGNNVDLTNISEADALRIAADEGCRFLQLAKKPDAPAPAATATATAGSGK